VTDHRIFAKLTQHWENEFHEDMKALNVCLHQKSIIVLCMHHICPRGVLIYHKLPLIIPGLAQLQVKSF